MNKKIGLIVGIVLMIVGISVYSSGHVYYPTYLDGDIIIVEWVFRDVYEGDIIGNPNFEPSFDEVNSDTFLQTLNATKEKLGYQFNVSQAQKSENTGFLFEITVDETLTVKYSEGFMILSFKDFDSCTEMFRQLLHTIIITLEHDADQGEIEQFLKETENISFLEYNEHFIPGLIDYRFYYEDDYEVHIEDMKMGH